MYKAIGRATVKGIVLLVRVRYGRQIRYGLALGAVAAAIGAYLLAGRDAPEG